ncbi:MAG: phosphoglycerate kinase [Thermomicrobiales bacterium]|nr:phosphoglycerate kinase [Thermomicrobiales bacterium]
MSQRSVSDADVRGKRVLVRVDFNAPLKDGEVTDDTRIRAALPTIRLLQERGAAVILASHLGRPKGMPNPRYSIAPAAARLAELLGIDVATAGDVVGPSAQAAAHALQPGQVLLLENTRFEPGEEKNDADLSRGLAELADVYVNDAFGAAHRAHSSTVGVAEYLPAYAGLLLLREVSTLSQLLQEPERPFVAILGGAKVSDKLAVIKHLIERVDMLLLGGGMANTFLLAEGQEIGNSLAEPDLVDRAQELLAHARARGVDILAPRDVIVAESIEGSDAETVGSDNIAAGQAVFDIGPETVREYCSHIAAARTVFWNGPMGVFEHAPFANGTLGIARCVADSPAFTVVGGGDSIAAIEAAGVASQIDHISTGGGASLELLEGRTLPGIAAIPVS